MKKEYIILGLIIVLLSAYLALHNRDGNNYALPYIPEVKIADINEIILEKDGDPITITRKDETWKVTDKNYPADSQIITKMLDVIKEMKVSALVSEAGENLPRYELGAENRIGVTVKSKIETVRKFDIGKVAPSYRHTFIRLDGNPSVYHAAKSFRRDFDKSVEDLRDKEALAFEKDKIKEISLEKDGIIQTLALEESVAKADDSKDATEVNTSETSKSSTDAESDTASPAERVKEWKLKKDGMSEPIASEVKEALETILSTLSTLKCSKYAETDAKDEAYKAQSPLAKLTLNGDKSHTLELFEKKEDGGDFPALSTGNAYPLFIGSYQGDNLLKKVNTVLGIEEQKEDEENRDQSVDTQENAQVVDAVTEQVIGNAVKQGIESASSNTSQSDPSTPTTQEPSNASDTDAPSNDDADKPSSDATNSTEAKPE